MKASIVLLAVVAVPSMAAEQHSNHSMREHMDDDPLNAMLLLDHLESHNAAAGTGFSWDANAWIGRDFNKLVLRSDGEVVDSDTKSASLEALWARPWTRWWDVVAGVRHEFQPRGSRTWLALGVTGVMRYQFNVQATAYVREWGSTALQVQAEYDLLITNRVILQPRLDFGAYGKQDSGRGIGAGASDLKLGLRLRYEIRREVAPYIGVAWTSKLGRTASLETASGEDVQDVQVLVGLRAWY
jgi:copper resistance protein B